MIISSAMNCASNDIHRKCPSQYSKINAYKVSDDNKEWIIDCVIKQRIFAFKDLENHNIEYQKEVRKFIEDMKGLEIDHY